MKPIFYRVLLSFAAVILFGWLGSLFNAGAQLIVGGAAASQFDNSDASFLQFSFLQKLFNGGVLPVGVLFVVLAAIWWKPLASAFKKKNETIALLVVGAFSLLAVMPKPALAYYDKTDRAEWVEVGANQSAFLLPMVGANKDKQKQFGSVQYLNENKIPAKRVQIPHAKAENTSAWSDYYVPTAKLFIVDRTPFMREWNDFTDKGTSVKKEGFHFESAEGIDVNTGITISAYVTEEDAAKFFYWFGSAAAKQATTPEEVFASVAYGKSLTTVMDSVVRGKVQAVLAKEFGARKLKDGIASKAAIIDAVEKSVREAFADKGITISYIGFSGALNFSSAIQLVIDQIFIAETKYAAKDALMAVTEVDKRNAEIGVTVATGETMKKWNGTLSLPSFLMLPDGFMNAVSGWFSPASSGKK